MLSIHRLLKVACPLAAFSVPLVWFTIDNHMKRERERSSDIVESMFKPSKLAACMIHSRMKTCWPAVGNMSCLWLHGSWELIVCCFKSFLGGMTWLVATIFDSTQFKVCMCKLGVPKCGQAKPDLLNCSLQAWFYITLYCLQMNDH